MVNVKKLLVLLSFVATTAQAQTYTQDVRYSTATATGTALFVTAASAYAAKNVVGGTAAAGGAGLLSFGNVCKASQTIQINSVQVTDKSDNAVGYDLQLFSSNPTASTITDKVNMVVASADLPKLLPTISLDTSDHFSFSTTNGQSSLTSLDSGGFVSTTGGTLYGALITRGSPTYSSTSDISVKIGYKCN